MESKLLNNHIFLETGDQQMSKGTFCWLKVTILCNWTQQPYIFSNRK